SGKRTLQRQRTTGCTATIVAPLPREEQSSNAPYFYVKVTKQSTTDDHPVSKRLYGAYAENRAITDEAVLAMIEEFVKVQTPFQRIHQYHMKSHRKSCRISSRKSNKTVKKESEEGRVQPFLQEFAKSQAGNVVDMLRTTPTKKRYKRYSFMVHDAFGKGQFAQHHALIAHETEENMEFCVESFKRHNPKYSGHRI
ncbi:TPA: hypothetical protein N0F65_011268, partial [Lagenidium giganteum]